jgi:hypothetical protein
LTLPVMTADSGGGHGYYALAACLTRSFALEHDKWVLPIIKVVL